MVIYLMSGRAEMQEDNHIVWCVNLVSGYDRIEVEAKFSVWLFQQFPSSIYERHKIIFIREVKKEELTQLLGECTPSMSQKIIGDGKNDANVLE